MKKLVLLFLLINFRYFIAFSQDEILEINHTGLPYSDSIFIVESFSFNIDGKTKQSALIRAGELTTGLEIYGISALEKYIQDKTQILLNQRVLESVFLDYSVGQINDNGKYPVDILVNVKDTNNFIILPDPQYSTSYGFGLSLNFIHNNFLGTMSPFEIDVGYEYDEYGQSNYLLSLENGIPFRVFRTNLNLFLLNEVKYRPHLDKPLYYRNAASLSASLPFSCFTFTPSFIFSYVYNDEKRIDDVSYGGYDHLFFGPEMEIKHIDWIGNFRKGFSISVSQLYYNYIYLKKYDANPWGIFNKISAAAYFKLSDFFGVSSRLMFRHLGITSLNFYAGDVLRGILDKDVYADMTLSLNLDFPFKVFTFMPSQWFNNKKLEIFNFDLHLVPVIDTAVYHNQSTETENFYDNILVSGGIEAVIYPHKFRSFCFRISFGKAIKENIDTGSYELFIGGRLFY